MENLNAKLFTDGGSRGNPGPAGIGWNIRIEDGRWKMEDLRGGQYIGVTTNNVAEYKALIRGLEECQKLGVRQVECFLDSNLVVNQMKGLYKIKEPHLAKLAGVVKQLETKFTTVSYTHISREKNAVADKEVNKALDAFLGRVP